MYRPSNFSNILYVRRQFWKKDFCYCWTIFLLFILWLSNLVFISVYGNYAWQILIFHRNFMARFFAMKSGFKIDQSSIPSPKICNTCNWNLYFNTSAVLHIKVLYFTTKISHIYLDIDCSDSPSHENPLEKRTFYLEPSCHQIWLGENIYPGVLDEPRHIGVLANLSGTCQTDEAHGIQTRRPG